MTFFNKISIIRSLLALSMAGVMTGCLGKMEASTSESQGNSFTKALSAFTVSSSWRSLTFSEQDQILDIEFTVNPSGNDVLLLFGSSTSSNFKNSNLGIRFLNGRIRHLDTSVRNNWALGPAYSNGRNYRFHIVADIASQRYDIDVNGTRLGSGVRFYGSTNSFSKINYKQSSSGTRVSSIVLNEAQDTTPPTVNISSGPQNSTTQTSASFQFSGSDDSGSVSFQCRLNTESFSSCSSSRAYSSLSVGSHRFDVRASDPSGNTATDSYTWTINSPPPPPSNTPSGDLNVTSNWKSLTFPTQDETLNVEFTVTPNGNDIFVLFGNANSSNFKNSNLGIRFLNGRFRHLDTSVGNNWATGPAYQSGRDYQVKIVANLTTQRYDIDFNGARVGTGVRFKNSANSLSKMNYKQSGSGTQISNLALNGESSNPGSGSDSNPDPTPAPTPEPAPAPTPTPAPSQNSTPQYPCLAGKSASQIKQGPSVLNSNYNSKNGTSPTINDNDVLDLRETFIPYLGNSGARNYPITIENDRGVCVVGGEFVQTVPLDDSWSEHYAHGNSSSILFYYGAQNGLIQGAYTFNAHDSFRTARSDSSNLANKKSLVISGIWADYNRDDVIENESSIGGDITIKDSLMSTFVGFSTRLKNQPANARAGDTFTVDSVILRMEPMPEPHKASSRRNIVKNGVRYGHGHLFKTGSGGIKWVIKNNIFMFEMIPSDDFINFPDASRVKECDGNTVIWAGPANQFDEFVAKHKASGCTNHTVTMDFSIWQNAVDDWHDRYPDVGRSQKPTPGAPYDMSFPRR